VPRFRRVTFRRGYVGSARFAPDGQTIVYSAAWQGRPAEIFTTRAGSVDSRPLLPTKADVLSISSEGDIALLITRPTGVPDMLARLSLAGGAPKDVLEDVVSADWAPDGKSLAVIRSAQGTRRLEFPIGKTLLESPGLFQLRVSPDGRLLAVSALEADGVSISVVDQKGGRKRLSGGSLGGPGLAWTPDGREVWFTQAFGAGPPSLWAVGLDGRLRAVYRSPHQLTLLDISWDGRALVTGSTWHAGLNWLRPGETKEQDVSWLDASFVADLSADGRLLLFDERREGGLPDGLVFLRQDPSQPALRLGEGLGLALSPDAKWALAFLRGKPGSAVKLTLLPTGAGEQRTLSTGKWSDVSGAQFLPDSKRFVVRATEPGKPVRLYVDELSGGEPRPITEGATYGWVVSPDGERVAARVRKEIRIFPIHGGDGERLAGQETGDLSVQWSADGRFLYVCRLGEPPVRIDKVEIASGRREFWKEIAPADSAGLQLIRSVRMTPDGGSYAYTYDQHFSDLYVVEGLR
jgi:eukaryotic-like serine/threonine-protein kinase